MQRGLWGEAAKKRADDHKLQMAAIGGESSLTGDDMPGDINIYGDKYEVTHAAPATAPAQPVAPTVAPVQPAAVPTAKASGSLLWPAVLGAALLGTGAGGTMLYHYLTDKPSVAITNPAAETQDWKLGVKVTDKP